MNIIIVVVKKQARNESLHKQLAITIHVVCQNSDNIQI